MSELIGIAPEMKVLKESLSNNKSELITVSGIRRVGKTFLIREFYQKNIVFEVTGLFWGDMKDQLSNFSKEVFKRTNSKVPVANSWLEMFIILENYLDTKK